MLTNILIIGRTTVRHMSSTPPNTGSHIPKDMKNRFEQEIRRWISKKKPTKEISKHNDNTKTPKTNH